MWVERVEICGLPRSSERAHGSLYFPLLDLEPLLDLSGWRDDGSAGLGSRVIRMHTYTSTSILISNSIIHPEIENPSYPYHPTRRTESYSPRIYLSPGCLPPGFLCQFMSDPMGNLPPSQGSWAKWTVCIFLACVYWIYIYGRLNWDLICYIVKAFFSHFIYYSPSECYLLLPSVRNCFVWFNFIVSGTWWCSTAGWGWQEGAYIGSGVSVLERTRDLE